MIESGHLQNVMRTLKRHIGAFEQSIASDEPDLKLIKKIRTTVERLDSVCQKGANMEVRLS